MCVIVLGEFSDKDECLDDFFIHYILHISVLVISNSSVKY